MPSVDDWMKYLNGDINEDQIRARMDESRGENPLQDWDTHDRATGMYDSQRAFNTTVGLREESALHDRSKMSSGPSVADFQAMLDGKMSVGDLVARGATTYNPVADMHRHDQDTGLYDHQRGSATNYGLDREMLEHDINTGRFDRERTVEAPADVHHATPAPTNLHTHDPVDDMRRHDIANGTDQPSYSDYQTYNNYGANDLWR